MQAFFWAALAFLVVALVGGTAYVGRQAWRAWQAVVSLAAAGAAGIELIDARSAGTTAKAERVAAGADELLAAVASLERARARRSVLFGAVDEIFDTVRALASWVPQK